MASTDMNASATKDSGELIARRRSSTNKVGGSQGYYSLIVQFNTLLSTTTNIYFSVLCYENSNTINILFLVVLLYAVLEISAFYR